MNNKLIIKIYITMSILIIMFLIGILSNLSGKIIAKEEKITNLQIELDSEKEMKDILIKENERLKIILNNYTIEKRREVYGNK